MRRRAVVRRIETQGVGGTGPWMQTDGRRDGSDARDMSSPPYFFGNHIGHAFEVGARYPELGKLIERHALEVSGARLDLFGGQVHLKLIEDVLGDRALS